MGRAYQRVITGVGAILLVGLLILGFHRDFRQPVDRITSYVSATSPSANRAPPAPASPEHSRTNLQRPGVNKVRIDDDTEISLDNPDFNNISPEAIRAISQAIAKKLREQESQRKEEPNGRPPIPITGDPENLERLPWAEKRPVPPKDDGSHMDSSMVKDYVASVMNLGVSTFWRMGCPDQDIFLPRYQILKSGYNVSPDEKKIKWLFSLDLFQVIDLLPRLLGSIVEVTRMLGPENCMLSIVEGRSSDGTYLVLYDLIPELKELGLQYRLQQTDVNPHEEGKDRIEELAKLRDAAMAPLVKEKDLFVSDPVTLFINDIALCPQDILELLYQHVLQQSTMTCSMDWLDAGNLFYDSWVSRSMSGNTFFEIPQDLTFAYHHNLFWDEPVAHEKFHDLQPFQVYACWGGMVALDSRPFMDGTLHFRRSHDDECYAGEPMNLAADLAIHGISRVATVPTINVAYNDADCDHLRRNKGHVCEKKNCTIEVLKWEDDTETQRIEWMPPPPRIRCMPGFGDAWWVDPIYPNPKPPKVNPTKYPLIS